MTPDPQLRMTPRQMIDLLRSDPDPTQATLDQAATMIENLAATLEGWDGVAQSFIPIPDDCGRG